MEKKDKKQYTKPEIILETNLETKAGSPLGVELPEFELPDLNE